MITIDPKAIEHLESAFGFCFVVKDRNELIRFFQRDIPTLAKRAPASRRGAPPKDNLRRFLEELSFRFEKAGGVVSGSWNKDASGITGDFAKGLAVIYDEILPHDLKAHTSRLTFLREVKKLRRHGWRANGCWAAADYAITTMNAWRRMTDCD